MDPAFTSASIGIRNASKEKSLIPLRRSCEVCRTSKSRCWPSKEDFGRCQKCVKDGKECIFLEAKPRPKRAKTSRTRVAEMEEKLDGLFALLSSANLPSPSKEISLPASSFSVESPVYGRPEAVCTPRSQTVLPPWMPPLKSGPRFDDEFPDVISKDIISFEHAERLLRNFNITARNFPFVVVYPKDSLDFVRREKPFLLLCILTVSVSSSMLLQKKLESEVRDSLSRKLIINCERNLDLLQGLLVYLSWYHRYFDPNRQQIYQLSQMVIAMAIDLGITRPDTPLLGYNPTFSWETSFSLNRSKQRFPSELEAKRTLLGCYYLSSCLAIALRKPNYLKYSDYIEECCQTLTQANDAPSDHSLSYFIRLQRLAEEINITFDYDRLQELPLLDAVRIEMLIKAFTKQLRQFEETFPKEIQAIVAIRMTFLHLPIYINEIGLHAAKQHSTDLLSGQPSCRDWYSSAGRTEALISCINATKKYTNEYLSLSKEDMLCNSIMQETQLIYAVLILGRYTTGVDSPFLDAAQLREMAQFDYYVTALADHMGKLIVFADNGQEQIDVFWHFKRIFHHTLTWFLDQVRGGYFTTLEMSGFRDCTHLSFMEILEMEPTPQMCGDVAAALMNDDELWSEVFPDPWPTSTLDPRKISMPGSCV